MNTKLDRCFGRFAGRILAALAMLLLVARPASAVDPQWRWFVFSISEVDGTATIWNNLGLKGKVEVPSEADGHTVLRVGTGAFAAFNAGVTEVVIPLPIAYIETAAFYHCVDLRKITLPASIISIEPGAFDYCISLRSIDVDPINPYFTTVDGALFNKDKTTLMQFPGGRTNSYVIPDGATRIEGYAFGSLYSVTNVVIPASVREIGSSAFYGCSGLTSITLPEGLTVISTNLFQNCSKLTSITIPDSVREIQFGAFNGCTSLTNVTLGGHLRSIDNNAFEGCTNLRSLTVPDSAIAIGNYAFAGCASLTNVTLGRGLMSIGNYAFRDCTSLAGLTIPDGISTIEGQNAGWLDQVVFTPAGDVRLLSVVSSTPSSDESVTVSPHDTSKLTNGTMPFTRTYKNNTVVSLTAPSSAGVFPFQKWQKDGADWATTLSTTVTMDAAHVLTAVYGAAELTLADAVDMPGWSWVTDGKPGGWSAETTVTHDGVDAARSGVIGHSQITWMETTMSGAGTLTFWWKMSSETNHDFLSFAVDGVEQAHISGEMEWVEASVPLTKAGNHTLRWTYATDGTTIGASAFAGCTSLTNVTIGDGVIAIGASAFSGCSRLSDIRIGRGVRFIGDQAFTGCGNLRAITVDVLNPAFSSVDGVLFNQRGTMLIQYPTARIGKYAIPDGVEIIGTYAFSSAYGLTGVTFPSSVTNIESFAFYRCTQLVNITLPAGLQSIGRSAFNYNSLLTGVYFEGNQPSLGEYAFNHDSKLTVYFLDGTTGWKSKYGGRPTKRWYSDSAKLEVTIVGSGTLTPNYSEAMRQLGSTNTMTAAGANGYAFQKWLVSTNWGDSVTSTNAKLTFVMQSNLTIAAVFIPATYVGLYLPAAANEIASTNAGSVTLTLTDKRSLSGKLVLAGKSLSFSGGLDWDNRASLTNARSGNSPIVLDLGLDSLSVTGRVSSAGWSSPLQALPRATATSNILAGSYTMLVMGEHGAVDAPPGDSPMKVSLTTPYTIKVTGSAADGAAVNVSAALTMSDDGVWPFYASLYSGNGLMIGWLSCASNAATPSVQWFKSPNAVNAYYPAGFSRERDVALKRYVAPGSKQNALGWTNGVLFLGGGNLSAPIQAEVVVTNNRIKSVSGSVSNLSLVITNSSGLFGGSFVHPVTLKSVAIRGAVVQGLPWEAPANQVGVGGGWFPGTNQYGHVWIEPKK